ncbi:hypothetical protein JCM9279_004376 [Rhodotorula babjevae]
MSNESLSNKVGNATSGTVGEETILHQATHLASSTLDYAKGLVGVGEDAGAKSGEDAANNAHGANSQHTLGELVGEARDLAANVLHTASDVLATGAAKAQDAAGDAQQSAESGQPKGYVAQARDLAAGALQQVEGLIATGQKKVEQSDLKGQADQAASTLGQKVDETKKSASSAAQDASETTKGYAAAAQKDVADKTA